MSTGKLLELLNSIAEELILIDMRNLHEIARLLALFESFREESKVDFPNATAVADKAIKSLEAFLLADMNKIARESEEVVSSRLSENVTLLQGHLMRGTDVDSTQSTDSIVTNDDMQDSPTEPTSEQLETPTQPIATEPVIEPIEDKQPLPEPEVKPIKEPIILPPPIIAKPIASSTEEKDLSGIADKEMLTDFITEANDHLNSAEEKLLELEQRPDDKEAINTVFRAFHTLKGVAGLLGLEDIGALAHEAENLLDGIRRKSDSISGATLDVSFKSVDFLKRQINRLAESMHRNKVPVHDPTMEPLIQLIQDALNNRQSEVAKPRENLQERATDVAYVPVESSGDGRDDSQLKSLVREPIRVDAERLDRLIDMIGELVIAEAMMQQDLAKLDLADASHLLRNASHLHKITRELQSSSLSLRMIPVRPVFQKMARMVRDLSKKSNKKIEFEMEGEDTELDKSVVDKIGDPLVHMIRNAIDHGVESAEERVKSGKNPTGRILLRAFHQGSSIYIELTDDGAGLDRDRILEKGRERGLVRPDENPTEDQIFNLIFHPGFSTARQVTGLSGRGVGMDVVRRNVESLRGSVEIKSAKGVGTTIYLRLPLTLAIIDGMLFQIGSERYILPTFSIVETLRLMPDQLTTVTGRGEMMRFRGSMIPLYRMNRVFSISNGTHETDQGIVLVVEENQERVAIFADELLGQYQVVIKNLGQLLADTKGIAGGAIMADGRVGLIVDLHGFLELARTVN